MGRWTMRDAESATRSLSGIQRREPRRPGARGGVPSHTTPRSQSLDDARIRVVPILPVGPSRRGGSLPYTTLRPGAAMPKAGRGDGTATSPRIDALRARLPAAETDEIVRWIREERAQRLP